MPENVRDRDELLLNAIVTGDTSGIDPRDREETFIKAIAEKNTSALIATSSVPNIVISTAPGGLDYDVVAYIKLTTSDGKEIFSGYDNIVSNWEKLKTPVFVDVVGTGQYADTMGNVLFIPIPDSSDALEWIVINKYSMTFSNIQISKYYDPIRLFVKQ